MATFVIFGITSAIVVVYLCVLIIYRVYLSPLSKFPGPKWCAATRLVASWQTIAGNRLTWTDQLHKQYGDIVRIAPDELSFIHPQSWKDIYGRSRTHPNGYWKDPKFYAAFQGIDGPSLLNNNDRVHSQLRPYLAGFFGDKSLRENEHVFQDYVGRLVQWLSVYSTNGEKADLQLAYNSLGFDLMSALIFRESLNMLGQHFYHPWLKQVYTNVKAMAFQSVLGYFPIVNRTVRAILPQSVRDLEAKHFAFVNRYVDERISLGAANGASDLWSSATNFAARRNLPNLSLNEIRANAALLLVAGSETSAVAMCGVTYLLLTNPSCMKRLKTELEQKFPQLNDVTLASVSDLPYLTACIQEALRVYPPSPLSLPRRTPLDGAGICGQWIPGDTAVGTSHYAAYRSGANFHRPDEFLPERWLSDAPAEFLGDRRDVFQPFSYGQRNCLGQSMAWYETRLALATVFRRFNFNLCEESKDFLQQKNYVLWEKIPLLVRLSESWDTPKD